MVSQSVPCVVDGERNATLHAVRFAYWLGFVALICGGLAAWLAFATVAPDGPPVRGLESCGTALARSAELDRLLAGTRSGAGSQFLSADTYAAVQRCENARVRNRVLSAGSAVAGVGLLFLALRASRPRQTGERPGPPLT